MLLSLFGSGARVACGLEAGACTVSPQKAVPVQFTAWGRPLRQTATHRFLSCSRFVFLFLCFCELVFEREEGGRETLICL